MIISVFSRSFMITGLLFFDLFYSDINSSTWFGQRHHAFPCAPSLNRLNLEILRGTPGTVLLQNRGLAVMQGE